MSTLSPRVANSLSRSILLKSNSSVEPLRLMIFIFIDPGEGSEKKVKYRDPSTQDCIDDFFVYAGIGILPVVC